MAKAHFQVGTSVGGYELRECIGAGGYSEVWHAIDPDPPNATAAIKLLRPTKMGRELDLELAVAEAQRLQSVHNDNVVRVLKAGRQHVNGEDIAYIIMESCRRPSPGGHLEHAQNLADVVYPDEGDSDPRATSARGIANILKSICRGIEACHRMDLVHGDIKPANVLLLADGRVKVIDFNVGFALPSDESNLDPAKSAHVKTRNSHYEMVRVIGTVDFMAPEQAQGKELAPPADIYSIGALGYYLITGGKTLYTPADSAEDPVLDLIEQKATGKPDPTKNLWWRAPSKSGLRKIIAKALSRNPPDRYATCREFERALEQWEASAPQASDGLVRRARLHFRRRIPEYLAVVSTAMLFLVAYTAMSAITHQSEVASEVVEQTELRFAALRNELAVHASAGRIASEHIAGLQQTLADALKENTGLREALAGAERERAELAVRIEGLTQDREKAARLASEAVDRHVANHPSASELVDTNVMPQLAAHISDFQEFTETVDTRFAANVRPRGPVESVTPPVAEPPPAPPKGFWESLAGAGRALVESIASLFGGA